MNAVIYIHGKGGSAAESGKFNVGRKFVWNRCKKYNVEKKIKVALRCYTATLGNPVRAGNRKKSHAYIF